MDEDSGRTALGVADRWEPPEQELPIKRPSGASGLILTGLAVLIGSALVTAALVGGLLAPERHTPPTRTVPGVSGSMEVATPLRPRYLMAVSEGLERPMVVAASPEGRLYVADGGCRCVRVFTARGEPLSTLGPAVGDEEMQHPVAVALDGAGALYVADLAAGRLLRFKDDVYRGPLDKGEVPDLITAPAGISFEHGLLYVNDLARHQVLAFDTGEWKLRQTFGAGKGSDIGSLAYPNFSLVLADGSVLVADSNNNRLQRFDTFGEFAEVWPGPLLVPRGLAQDSAGNIHVANALSGRVEVFSGVGRYLGGYAGLAGATEEFGFPTDIEVQGDIVYVVDRGNARLLIGSWR